MLNILISWIKSQISMTILQLLSRKDRNQTNVTHSWSTRQLFSPYICESFLQSTLCSLVLVPLALWRWKSCSPPSPFLTPPGPTSKKDSLPSSRSKRKGYQGQTWSRGEPSIGSARAWHLQQRSVSDSGNGNFQISSKKWYYSIQVLARKEQGSMYRIWCKWTLPIGRQDSRCHLPKK